MSNTTPYTLPYAIGQYLALVGIVLIALLRDGGYTDTVLIGLISYIGGNVLTQVAGHISSAYVATRSSTAVVTTPVAAPTPQTPGV